MSFGFIAVSIPAHLPTWDSKPSAPTTILAEQHYRKFSAWLAPLGVGIAWLHGGLPAAIRTDNGVPFAAPWALFGLSRLAVWWLRLGIRLQRIKPGKPQQNGRHERMHLTLKKDATKPAAATSRSPPETSTR